MYTCGTGFDGYANQLQTTKDEGALRPVNAQGELGRKTAASTALMPGEDEGAAQAQGHMCTPLQPGHALDASLACLNYREAAVRTRHA